MKGFAKAAWAAIILFSASPALADDPMAGAYGNTISIEYPDKTIDTLYVRPDGTYVLDSVHLGFTTGTWSISGGQTCFTQLQPATDQPPACSPTVAKQPGDTWQGVGRGGVPVTIKIWPGT